MKKWQKYWLYFVIAYSLLHIVRDIFQDLRINNLLSTLLVKTTPSKLPIYWKIANTYIIAVIEILLSSVILIRNNFGRLGRLTIFITLIIIFAWSFYWFYL